MTEAHAHPTPNYMAVFYILFAATIAEVGVTYLGLSEGLMIVILLAMAMFKAILVALYFMHLKYDNVILSVIAGVPLLLVAIVVSVVAYEYTTYSQIDPSTGQAPVAKPAANPAHESAEGE